MLSTNPLNALGVFGETTTASGTLPRLWVTVQKPLPSVTQVACAAWTIGAGDGPTAAEAPAKTTAPAVTARAPAKAANAFRVMTIPPSEPGVARPPSAVTAAEVSRFVRRV